jgi:hypothetical protein
MKLCRNCRTINEDHVTACARCKMKAQLVDYTPELPRAWQKSMPTNNKVAATVDVCKNCGTPDYGKGAKCARCHFPLKTSRRSAASNSKI